MLLTKRLPLPYTDTGDTEQVKVNGIKANAFLSNANRRNSGILEECREGCDLEEWVEHL